MSSRSIHLAVITVPDFFQGEADLINSLFSSGLELLHLRKPGSSVSGFSALLSSIDPAFRPRIALHDHHSLAPSFAVGGVHLNARSADVPALWTGRVSRSCHSFEEVSRFKPSLDYCFLSPVFNSVSKSGYNSAFSLSDLRQKGSEGLIDDKVFALGGISENNIQLVESLGFGGCAVLGSLWNFRSDEKKMLNTFARLKDLCTFVPG